MEYQDSEELHSLASSPTPSYDATGTHFTNVQIDLLPGHEDSLQSREQIMGSDMGRNSGNLFNSCQHAKDKHGQMQELKVAWQSPQKTSPRMISKYSSPPSTPTFSYYDNNQRENTSPESSIESYVYTGNNNYANTTHHTPGGARVLFSTDHVTNDQSTQTMTLLTRHRMESGIQYHYFSLQEDFDHNVIHVQKSFAPIHFLGVPVILRLLFCHLTYAVLRSDYNDAMHNIGSNRIMYFAHLSNITLIISLLYQCMSSFLSVLALILRKSAIIINQPSNGNGRNQNKKYLPSGFVCFTWMLYSISLPGEFMVAIGYWLYDYDPDGTMTFINLYKHAFIGILLLIDGLIVGRIPLRAKHWKGIFVYGFIYLIWSMAFSYYKMGEKNGIIYEFIDWRNDPYQASSVFFLLLFVTAPMVFSFCWLISLSDGMCSLICCSFNGKRRHLHLQTEILPTRIRVLTAKNISRSINDDADLQIKFQEFAHNDIMVLECEKGGINN